jgi:hypothetical protein
MLYLLAGHESNENAKAMPRYHRNKMKIAVTILPSVFVVGFVLG